MVRAKIADRNVVSDVALDDAEAFSVTEFCRRNRISVQLFYKLKPQGLMPPTFRLGARVRFLAKQPQRGVASVRLHPDTRAVRQSREAEMDIRDYTAGCSGGPHKKEFLH